MNILSHIRHGILIVVICGFAASMSIAVAEEEAAKEEKQKKLKPQATCPIMGTKIDKELYVDAKGKRIYVCCKACLEPVKKDPDAALKKLAERGEEAEDIPIEQKVCPIMKGNPINKDLYVEYEGKKLYVCCQACLEVIKKDPAKYAKEIDEQITKDKEKEKESKEKKDKAEDNKHDHSQHKH